MQPQIQTAPFQQSVPPVLEQGGFPPIPVALPAAIKAPSTTSSSNDFIPMQFATPSGGVSWIGIVFLGLSLAALTYQIINSHTQIVHLTASQKRIDALEKQILELNKRNGLSA